MNILDRLEDWHYRAWHWFDHACAGIVFGPDLSLNDPLVKSPVPYDPPRVVPGAAASPVEAPRTAVSPGASRTNDSVGAIPVGSIPRLAPDRGQTAQSVENPRDPMTLASNSPTCHYNDVADHECEDWWGEPSSTMCRLSRSAAMLANFYAHHGRDAEDIIGGTKYR